MSDVIAVTYLLLHSGPLLAAVPAARITPGKLPEKSALPAVSVRHITGTRRKTVDGSIANQLCTGRVQITVHAANYAQQKAVLKLVRTALPATRGTINGVVVDSIEHALDGPDMSDDEAEIYEESVDYWVRFIE